jgi:predicted amino acid-binding ACT domain protein
MQKNRFVKYIVCPLLVLIVAWVVCIFACDSKGDKSTESDYLVVASAAVMNDAEWAGVANSLAAKFGDKIVTVKWDKDLNSGSNYLARVSFKGTDRIGMINDITRVTSKVMNVNIRRINLGTEDGIFDGFIDLYVHDIDDLENLILKLKNIKGIESVARKEL